MYMKNIIQSLKVIVLGLVLAVGLSYAFAWTAPTASPPGGNVSAPVNVGDNTQYKLGNLVLNDAGGFVNGLIVRAGNVGIGTVSPTEKLEVAGNVSILPSLGLEQIDNGTFENTSYWDFNKNWSFDAVNREADHAIGENNNLQQKSPTTPIIADRTYQVVFTVKNRTTGTVRPKIGGTFGLPVSSNIPSTQQITTTTNGTLAFDPSTDFNGSIDDVSLKILSDGNLDVAGNIKASGTVCDGTGACIGGGGVILSGVVNISITYDRVGFKDVNIASLGFTDTNYKVLLTSHPSFGGFNPVGPDGVQRGPLYVPFLDTKTPSSFKIMVYDIQSLPYTANIPVEYAVIK